MDALNVSSRTSKYISQLDCLSKEDLGKVCKCFLQTLIKGTSNVALEESMDGALCAVSTLLLEAARSKSSEEQLRSLLVEIGSDPLITDTLCGLYAEHVDTLVEHLEATGIAAPMIVGVDWRLDYSIRSRNAGRENAPVYYVTLRVKDRGIIRDITMLATLEELQDMLSKVRDAVKQVDRVLNKTEV